MNLMLSMMDDFVPIGEGEDVTPAPGVDGCVVDERVELSILLN